MRFLFPGRRSQQLPTAEQETASLRPPPPLAKRLNRNALTVAAVIMGMTVLTAIVLLTPGRTSEKSGGAVSAGSNEPPAVPPRPAFLDEPMRQPVQSAIAAEQADSSVLADHQQRIGSAPSRLDAELPNSGDRAATAPNASAEPPESARDRAFQAALSSLTIVGSTGADASSAEGARAPSVGDQEQQLLSLGDSIMRTAIRPGGSVGTAASTTGTADAHSTSESSHASDDASFAERAAYAAHPITVAQIEPAGSVYTLRAGTVLPGLLLTAINSDLPGAIVGQVSRDVYDSRTQRIPLIPKGSRLIGTYENQIAAGQGRLLVAWTRMIFPDGRSMRLPGLALTDPAGQTGAKDKVDNHWRRVFGNALLLSAIGAGAQLSQPPQTSVLSTPSAGQVAAGAVGQELSSVALEILRRGMDVAPTITIRAGQPFNVFLSGDLVFDAPYQPIR